MKEYNSTSAQLGCVINNSILNFTHVLLKNILLKTNKRKNEEILDHYIKKINKDIIINEEKYINLDYSISNFDNIINIIKNQNSIYTSEILENILLKIFAKVIKVERDQTVNAYIFNNLNKIRNEDTYLYWFQQEKFNQKELNNLKQIINQERITYFHNSPFCYLIYRINYEKYNLLKISQKKNSKLLKYIYNDCIPEQKILDNIYESMKSKSNYEKDFNINSIMHICSNFTEKNKSNDVKVYIDIIKNFLYSVFIYYQTKNSSLINYGKEELDSKNNILSKVPYSFDLKGGLIEGRFANTVISPIRLDNRIENILLGYNNMRELGMYELGKSLIFNNAIKTIHLDRALLKPYSLDYFILGMDIFDNKSVKELILSSNYLTENAEQNLRKIIHKFKELKTLNLSNNTIKDGLSSFFIILKRMFQKNETKIENLILNVCSLGDSSIFELGELLKNRFCKLKKLYIMKCDILRISDFLRKLKKNKILTNIYIGENSISHNNINDINKIVSNSGIQNLNIFKNKISNFKDALRIIYRTRIIKKDENEKNIKLIEKSDCVLQNLDISNNRIINKNKIYVKLLKEISEETSLLLLDFSKILYGDLVQKFDKNYKNKNYRNEVDNFTNILLQKKLSYKELIKTLRNLETNLERLNEDKFDYSVFDKMDNNISKIIKDKKAKYILYLREAAGKLIKDDDEGIEEVNEDMIIKLANYMMIRRIKDSLDEIKKKKEFYNMIVI